MPANAEALTFLLSFDDFWFFPNNTAMLDYFRPALWSHNYWERQNDKNATRMFSLSNYKCLLWSEERAFVLHWYSYCNFFPALPLHYHCILSTFIYTAIYLHHHCKLSAIELHYVSNLSALSSLFYWHWPAFALLHHRCAFPVFCNWKYRKTKTTYILWESGKGTDG